MRLILGSLYNVSSIEIRRREGQQYVLDQVIQPADDLIFDIISEPLRQGRNDFIAEVIFTDGRHRSSEVVTVYYVEESEVLVFPNPVASGDEVQILVRRQDVYSLDLYDMVGKKVMSMEEAGNPQMLDIAMLHSGMYLVVVRYEDGETAVGKLWVRG